MIIVAETCHLLASLFGAIFFTDYVVSLIVDYSYVFLDLLLILKILEKQLVA
jgi:hypothetical protein